MQRNMHLKEKKKKVFHDKFFKETKFLNYKAFEMGSLKSYSKNLF